MAAAWLEPRWTLAADHPEPRTLVAVDMERYGRTEWTDLTRVGLRRELAGWSAKSLQSIGLTEAHYHQHSIGDGYLISVDPHVPRDILLTTLMRALHGRLLAFNRRKPPDQRLRVRMAIHNGDVLRDPHPIEGRATILTFRLLDSQDLRECLRATKQPLAVIASQTIYDSIISQRYDGLDPTAWHPVTVSTKEGPERAWIHVPKAPARRRKRPSRPAGSPAAPVLTNL